MPAITQTVLPRAGRATVTETTLTGSGDTFTYLSGAGQILILRNPTGGAISPVIDGAGGTTVIRDGLGQVDVSAGYAVGSIGAGATVMISCDAIASFLQGAIAITSGSGLIGSLLRPAA